MCLNKWKRGGTKVLFFFLGGHKLLFGDFTDGLMRRKVRRNGDLV
jgi:hypothetical protein